MLRFYFKNINMNKFATLVLLTVLISCNSSKTGIRVNTQNNKQEATNLYRYCVSFISIGSGIDGSAKQQFLDFIKDFETKYNIKISYEVVKWGREGETDYCLKLVELKADEQNAFITNSKELLKTATLIRYSENSVCKNKRD